MVVEPNPCGTDPSALWTRKAVCRHSLTVIPFALFSLLPFLCCSWLAARLKLDSFLWYSGTRLLGPFLLAATWVGEMPASERCCLSWSLKRFLRVPLLRLPLESSPKKTAFGSRLLSIFVTLPAYLSWCFMSMASMLVRLDLSSTSSFETNSYHLMLRILRRKRWWNCSNRRICFLYRTQDSAP